ncbi:MAG: hypothetical protein QG635_989, partial [Bacteroidota bacterium]|nr:hypothetical protein [Bacteroidota bacterium]
MRRVFTLTLATLIFTLMSVGYVNAQES